MLKKLLLLVAILAVSIFVGVYGYLDILVKKGIETYGPKALGVAVTVGDVSISLSKGVITIRELRIENPSGFKEGEIFALDKISATLDIRSMFQPTLKIYELMIDRPTIVYELGEGGDNITAFRKGVERKAANDDVVDQSTSGDVSKKIIIYHFHMNDGKVTASIAKLATKSLSLPNIHIKDIGVDKGGISVADASDQIVRELNRTISKINLNELIGDLGNIKTKLQDLKTEALQDPAGTGKKLLNGLIGN